MHLRFMLVPFADVVTTAGPTCSCGQQVPCAGSLPTPWERLAHRHTCPDLAGLRTVVHNNVEGVLIDFLKDAGMSEVHTEPREWDADAVGSDDPADDDHRRPDIICLHPLTGMRYVLDNTLAWRALSGRGVEYDATGKFSKAAETRKKKAYAPAKAREEARWRRKIRFIPLAFEISGGWGEEMAKFFEECVRLKKRRRSAEMYHWCAMEYGKHWRQRLSVTIIRGRVMVVTAAAARERGRGNGEAPEEISAHSLG